MHRLVSEVRDRLQEPEPEPPTLTRYRLQLVKNPAWSQDEPVRCFRPAKSAEILHRMLEGMDREVFGALLLDSRKQILGLTVAYIGTLWRTAVEPRGILAPALLANSCSFVLFHNHPSGDPSPSPNDLAFTRQMKEAGEILSLKLVDHIIIGERPAFISLRERGDW